VSLVTVGKNGRVYPRLFDHDEALRLRGEGWTIQMVADHFGVSYRGVQRVTTPGERERMDAATMERFEAICDDCGGRCTHNWSNRHGRHDRVVCQPCAAIRTREEALMARLNEDGDVRCTHCDAYQPMSVFSNDRGYPRAWCPSCETESRKARRRANRDRENAWQREYKRKRRLAAS
jgi:hypothetical protein